VTAKGPAGVSAAPGGVVGGFGENLAEAALGGRSRSEVFELSKSLRDVNLVLRSSTSCT
jgi:hypothetical protein